MQQPFLPKNIYWLLFFLLCVVYFIGLFVPLLDNDSAHHANIALHMYLSGDYVRMIDEGKDYLDKPHLLFWLSAFSYHLFGVTSFAYKFPSFLFTIFGTYSTYRLGKSLYNKEVGKLSALIAASAFAYILANSDVRMDAILTASVAFATWQLVDWVDKKFIINAIGAAFGLALGFCTKGLIGVLIPAIGIFFYILYKKDWKSFYHWQLLLIIFSFFIFISPVLYCYFLQFDLHPEKIIRGKSGWSGVKFILWQQVFERYEGNSFGKAASKDYFFFFHTFLWAFAPWSVLTYIAFVGRLKSFISRKTEWLTIGTFPVIALIVTFSGFKLPHYINIIFPVCAVLTAGFLLEKIDQKEFIKRLFTVQIIVVVLCLAVATIVNTWAFPVDNFLIALIAIAFLIGGILTVKRLHSFLQKLIVLSAFASIVIFYLLNSSFYPQLLTYQAGNELAMDSRDKVNPKDVFLHRSLYSPSFEFYSRELRKDFSDSAFHQNNTVWVLTDRLSFDSLKKQGYPILQTYPHYDYNIGTMSLQFINPNTRKQTLDSLFLVRVK